MEPNVKNSPGAEGGLGRREVDARARARATLAQGAIAAGILAVPLALFTWFSALDFSPAMVAASAATACTTPVITYLQRAYVDPYRRIRRMTSSPTPHRSRHPRPPQMVQNP
jgi:hypothetical protein